MFFFYVQPIEFKLTSVWIILCEESVEVKLAGGLVVGALQDFLDSLKLLLVKNK